eukprot:16429651-Heterocapsa_arctica.AAC.2
MRVDARNASGLRLADACGVSAGSIQHVEVTSLFGIRSPYQRVELVVGGSLALGASKGRPSTAP